MSGFRRSLLAALLALGTFPAAAQEVRVAAPPLAYMARLTGPAPTLAAGPAFLKDAAAQAWFRAARPDDYPKLVQAALTAADLRKSLISVDDVRIVREAMLARPDVPTARQPEALLAAVDKDPELARHRRFYEAVVLDWSMVSADTRSLLAEDGVDEAAWRAADLPRRYEAIRAAYGRWVQRTVTAPVGTRAYAEQFGKALERTAGLMTEQERFERAQELKKAVEAAGGQERAQDAARKVIDEALAPARALDMTYDERAALTHAFTAALAREIVSTPVGRSALEAAQGRVGFVVRPLDEHGILGQYLPKENLVAVGEDFLVRTAAELGYTPRMLLEDSRALTETAQVTAYIVVHELEHARQFAWARANAPERLMGRHYNQFWELEAFTAQSAYIKQKRELDPSFAALLERINARGGSLAVEMATPDRLLKDPAKFRAWIAETYHRVPTLELAAARLIKAGRAEKESGARPVRAIDAELARRSRLARAERRRAEGGMKTGFGQYPDLRRVATSVLRHWKRAFATSDATMVQLARDLMARTRTEMSRLDGELRKGE